VIRLVSSDRRQCLDRTRTVIRHAFRGFLSLVEFLGVIEVKTSRLESLKKLKGSLIICNHPSLLDVVIIMSRVENLQCVVKKELWSNPLIGGVVRAAGYIRNDLDPEEFLSVCQEQLKQGENILIFPEGTRSKQGQPMSLCRGLGNLALAAGADIQSLVMTCKPIAYNKEMKWYHIPAKKPVFKLQTGRFFSINTYENDAPRSIRVRALMRDIQHYYNRSLGYE
jgi:1-acyl-sn-glycerol-3-phosphate acyltransferase